MNVINSVVTPEVKVVFLQNDYGKFPRGLALVEAEATSVHKQAEAMVGKPIEPVGYYKPYGSSSGKEDVIRLPRFEGWVGESHPDAKEVAGPFVAGSISVDTDRLPEDVFAVVTFRKNWPHIDAVICYNDLKPVEGRVKSETMTNCHNGSKFWAEILGQISLARKE